MAHDKDPDAIWLEIDEDRAAARSAVMERLHALPEWMHGSGVTADQLRDSLLLPSGQGAISKALGHTYVDVIAETSGRPMLHVNGDQVSIPTDEIWRAPILTAQSVIDRALPAVGRVRLTGHPEMDWAGTGWLVGDDLIVTNRHVADHFAEQQGENFVFSRNPATHELIRVVIDFQPEDQPAGPLAFDATAVYMDDRFDMAFLRVARTGHGGTALPSPIPLSTTLPELNAEVATIGYPNYDSRTRQEASTELTPADLRRSQQAVRTYLGGVINTKRVQPGRIKRVDGDRLDHDCSTLGGNSGSVVLDLASGLAVGLHYGGKWLKVNYAVPSVVIARRMTELHLTQG